MTQYVISGTAVVLAVASLSCAVDAWAADTMPTKAPPPAAESAPKLCTDPWDFIATNCQLTWHGITLYGTIDAGFGWQSHGAPFDPRSAVGASYLIQKQNRSPRWDRAPNALSNSFIGIKGTEPIGGGVYLVLSVEAGLYPYFFRLSTRSGSRASDACVTPNHANA